MNSWIELGIDDTVGNRHAEPLGFRLLPWSLYDTTGIQPGISNPGCQAKKTMMRIMPDPQILWRWDKEHKRALDAVHVQQFQSGQRCISAWYETAAINKYPQNKALNGEKSQAEVGGPPSNAPQRRERTTSAVRVCYLNCYSKSGQHGQHGTHGHVVAKGHISCVRRKL